MYLNPQPSTLNPNARYGASVWVSLPLNPKLQTSNPKPSTLNPKPSTLVWS